MRPTLQSRLQGSFKHGKHRRSHSMIMHVCEFDFLSLPARIMKPCVSVARLPGRLNGGIQIRGLRYLQKFVSQNKRVVRSVTFDQLIWF